MTTRKLVNLMMRSSDTCPYSGKLTNKQNVLAAISLANLCKEFADTGQMEEAMNIESSQWIEVISKLESKSLNCAQRDAAMPSYGLKEQILKAELKDEKE